MPKFGRQSKSEKKYDDLGKGRRHPQQQQQQSRYREQNQHNKGRKTKTYRAKPEKAFRGKWSSWFGFGGSDTTDRKNGKRSGAPNDKEVHEEARDLALEALKVNPMSLLNRSRVDRPWRALPGRYNILHPLHEDVFWESYFGRQAFFLRRGPNHKLPMAPSTAAGLMRSFRLGINANIVTARKMMDADEEKRMHAEYGKPASSAFARRQPVRLNGVEKRKPLAFAREPFLARLARAAPGRGVGVNLHWAPTGVAPLPVSEERYEQMIVQLYGARRWVICKRGLSKPPHPQALAVSGSDITKSNQLIKGLCTQVIMRRGDILHIPSKTWHWTTRGPGVSGHLALGVAPAILADVVALAPRAREYLELLGPAAGLGQPLPFWRYNTTESATPSVVDMCSALPWPKTTSSRDTSSVVPSVVCSWAAVRYALQRLAGRERKPTPQGSPTPRNSTGRERKRDRSLKNRTSYLKYFAEAIGLLGAIAFCCWACYALLHEDEDEETRRTKRSRYEATKKFEKEQRAARKHAKYE